jgi:mannose-6-phosphate isomerase-like protein (cupin superfamily)
LESAPTYETSTSRVWHLRTGDASGGEVHEQLVEFVPGSPFPPTHYHPSQDERFEIEHGAMLFVVGGEQRVVAAGQSIHITRGTPHRARNASGAEPALVRWETRPALRTTEFFLTAAALDQAGLLDSALLAHEYRDVFRLSGPLRALVPVVAAFSRLVGRTLPDPGRQPQG